MQLEEFSLERIQSLYENTVELNLSDSGVHPYKLNEILTESQQRSLLDIELGYGWTNGAQTLRETIANLYQGRNKEQIIVTNGSSEANFIMTMSLLEQGDELIVVVPGYMQIAGWAKGMGIKVIEVPLLEASGWLPDLAQLDNVVTDKTRMLTLCHPNNPTGSTLPVEQIEKLVSFAKKHDLYLHADEVYKSAEFDGKALPSFADLYDKAIVTCGLSKVMAVPGLRIGWLAGPEREVYKTWHNKDYTTITTGALSEYVANIVLQPEIRTKVLKRSKEYLMENLAWLLTWAEENKDWISFIPPKAGGMAFMKYAIPINSTQLVHELREQASVLLLPGDVFGMDGYLRVGMGVPKSHLMEGMKRVSQFVRTHYLKR